MDHNITLSLNKSIPVSFDATLFYDADNGTTTHESTNVTFSANSTSATVSLQSHNDGCHSLGLNTTAGHNFLSNWSWSAGEVQVGNTIYRISSKGNGCTNDDFSSANAQYCAHSSPVCNTNLTTACSADNGFDEDRLCDVGTASSMTPTRDPLTNRPIWEWSCTQGGSTVAGYNDGCWCRRPWVEFYVAGMQPLAASMEQYQTWIFNIGRSVGDSFDNNIDVTLRVNYTCSNNLGGHSGTETFSAYIQNGNVSVDLPCGYGQGSYSRCECSVNSAEVVGAPTYVRGNHGLYYVDI